MTAATNRSEQSSEKKEVVVRLFGTLGQLHGLVDDSVKMRFEHQLVFSSEERDASEDELE